MNTSQNPQTLIQGITKYIIEEMINELYYDIQNALVYYPAELANEGLNKYLLTLQTAIKMKSAEYFVEELLKPGILKDKRLVHIEKADFKEQDYDKKEFAEQHAKNTLNSYWLRAIKK